MPRAYLLLAAAFLGLPACMHFEDLGGRVRRTDHDRAPAPPSMVAARHAEAGPVDISPPSTAIESKPLPPPAGQRAGVDQVAPRGDDDTVISVVRGEQAAADPGAVRGETPREELEGGSPAPASETGANLLGAGREAPGQAEEGSLQLRGTFEESLAETRGPEFAGRATATGERFDPAMPMAAHPDMPLPSLAEIVNLENGKRMVVRVNDRQPATVDHEVAVSKSVADELGFSVNPAHVSMRYLGPAPALSDEGPAQSASLSAAPQPPVASAAAPGEGFVVQVGAFSNRTNAERLRMSLADSGQAHVEAMRAGGREIYRVRVGPWPNRAEAEAVRRRLLVSGFPGAVIAAR